jgi:hypothetical protein
VNIENNKGLKKGQFLAPKLVAAVCNDIPSSAFNPSCWFAIFSLIVDLPIFAF